MRLRHGVAKLERQATGSSIFFQLNATLVINMHLPLGLLAKGILSHVHIHDRDVDMKFGWDMVRISEDIHI